MHARSVLQSRTALTMTRVSDITRVVEIRGIFREERWFRFFPSSASCQQHESRRHFSAYNTSRELWCLYKNTQQRPELLSPAPVKETTAIRLKVCFSYCETVARGLRVTPPFLPSQSGSVPRYGPDVCVPENSYVEA